MVSRLATCWAFAAFVASTVSLPGPVIADFLLTVSGTYSSSSNMTDRTDGTTETFNDLPPLLDLDRLRGGTFTATYLFPKVQPLTGSDNATYSFDSPYGMTFTLFDASGAAVHKGSSSSQAFSLVFNDVNFGNVIDEAGYFAFVNDVSGVQTPSTLLTTDQALYAFQSGLVFSGEVNATANYLTDLSIPSNAATLLAFPNRTFSTGLEWVDGDADDFVAPYQIIDTFVSYNITTAVVSLVVPEPASALMLATGVAAIGGLSLTARRRRSVASPLN